ncbi:MAG: 2,3-bisphosphoglycerate-independent phosphoglycerate mutase [Candidatus Riflebacteria bacterium]|nr:2,3-bisphosphoglycerate-independent phosphoglycerate mutase [Candidatus Riflebacteria bacterium]
MNRPKKLFITILAGFGLSDKTEGNAVRAAKPEFIGKLFAERPFARLAAAGTAVGLPEGQMGDSDVGHLNIGSGRVVHQDITRINRSIADGSFFENPALIELIENTKTSGKKLHLLGLVSGGGVHSHVSHLYALLTLAKSRGLEKVFVHAITDGRDTPTTSGVSCIQDLCRRMTETGVGRVASISGRFYAMDRDLRWDRTEKAYHALVHGVGNRTTDPVIAVEASYKANVTDEFLVPVVVEEGGQPIALINNGDAVIFFNFRPDRMYQLTAALTDPVFSQFKCKEISVACTTFTRYSEAFSKIPVAFSPAKLEDVFGELLSQARISQFRCAETEKFTQVTKYFNGGIDAPFPLEDRFLVTSPKVKTFDLKPEMAVFEVGDILMERLHMQKYPVIVTTLANGDIVGHTGNFKATVEAIGAIDCVLSKVIPLAYDLGYDCIITGDHGNCEYMIDENTGEPFTEHTTNPVPFCLLSRQPFELRGEGKLADIAPSMLELLDLPKPAAMDGVSLLKKK